MVLWEMSLGLGRQVFRSRYLIFGLALIATQIGLAVQIVLQCLRAVGSMFTSMCFTEAWNDVLFK